MNQGPLRTPYDKNPGAQSDDVRCGGMGGWADGEVMLRKSGRGLANSTRADTHTHTQTHIRTHTAPLSTHTLALPAFIPSSSQPANQCSGPLVPLRNRNRNHCLSRAEASPPRRGPEDPAEAASSGDGGGTHGHTHNMSRHPTQAGQESHRLLYKSVGEAGNNVRQGIRIVRRKDDDKHGDTRHQV